MTDDERRNPCGAQAQLDTRALELASDLGGQFKQHMNWHAQADVQTREDRMALRDDINRTVGEVSRSISRVHSRIDELMKRWFLVAAAVIGLLLAILGSIVLHGLPWDQIKP